MASPQSAPVSGSPWASCSMTPPEHVHAGRSRRRGPRGRADARCPRAVIRLSGGTAPDWGQGGQTGIAARRRLRSWAAGSEELCDTATVLLATASEKATLRARREKPPNRSPGLGEQPLSAAAKTRFPNRKCGTARWGMNEDFNGVIQVDVRDSVPDWTPYQLKRAPEGAPNVLVVLYDDTGLAAWSPYGGRINMPTMDRLAARGLTYTQWHTTALCSPTRSTLLTGRNHHVNRCATIMEPTDGFPGAAGRLPDECATIGHILQDNGFSTFWVGKDHNVPEEDNAPGGSRSMWPLQLGFDRFYGFLGGETNNWYPDLVEDNRFIEQPYRPEEGYHLSKDLADQALQMLRNQQASNPSKPWYLWFCPGANHAPHHAPEEYIAKYEGAFDDGYEAYRERGLARMSEKGIMPEGTELTPLNPRPEDVANEADFVRPWEELNDDEKRLFARFAEVFAGFSEYTDAQVGRIVDYLEETGQLENTLIFYCADNGASGEGSPNGSVNENKFFNGYPDDLAENLAMIDKLGSPDTYNHYPTGWAAAFSSPFQMFKRYSQFAGGTCDPMVIHWPRGIEAKGEVRHQYHHSTDVVATVLDVVGLEMPETYRGVPQHPLAGVSMRSTFAAAPDAPTEKLVQ